MNSYVPILVLGALSLGFAVFSIAAGHLTGPRRFNRAKLDAYECGIEPTPQPVGGGRFPVKYYLTAMLFIIFDIEIIFLYPYVVSQAELGLYGFVAILIFSALFFVTFVYEVARGGLDWGPLQRLRNLDVDARAFNPERTVASTIRRVGTEGRPDSEEAA